MKPSLKWKRSNRQLFSTSKDKDNTPTSSSSSAVNTLVPTSPTTNNQLVPIQILSSIAALAIPEIILSIAEYLNRSSLINCALVCRGWSTIFQPLLFRVIHASDFDRIGFAEAFQDHARFANSIEWIQESPVEAPPPKKNTWRRIFRKKIAIKPPSFNRKPFEQLENSLVAGQTPALEKLSVRIQNQDPNLILRLPTNTVNNLQISTRGYPAKKPRIYIEDILRAYPSLVSLTLEGLYTLATHLSEGEHGDSSSSTPGGHFMVHTYLPQISAGSSSSSSSSRAAATPTTATEISSPTPISTQSPASSSSTSSGVIIGKGKNKCCTERPSTIQALKLRLVDISQDGLIAISAFMPKLQSLLIEEFLMPDMMIKIYRWTWSTEFIKSLQTSFPHLRSLRLAFPFDNMKESTIVEILKAFPLLTTVGFRNSHFGKDALETLQEHCRHVECLDVSFGYANREFKAALIRFLQTWPRLKELEADGIVFHLDRPVDENVQRTPWACTNLEKLVCGFHGTDSMIFQHLSQFPKLSYLTISYPSINIFPVESTLAWMANCTRMEYFWFCQHRHMTLDKSSIVWILNNWPNMKKLHVAGGMTQQKDHVKQWCKDAQRNSLIVEYDHHI